jgi:hypothetical protein
MDKHGLITEISKLTGYTKGDTEVFLDGFTQAIYNAIEDCLNLIVGGNSHAYVWEVHSIAKT